MTTILASGYPPGPGGTGRLVQALARDSAGDASVRLRWGEPGSSPPVLTPEERAAPAMILLHPQALGLAWCRELVEARPAGSVTLLYLLDAGFFCRRSYNHVPGESGACLRCLETDGTPAHELFCPWFPYPQPEASGWFAWLAEAMAAERVRLAAQTRTQAELAARHFRIPAPPVIGMQADDLTLPPDTTAPSACDVVFHGHPLPAKGVGFALDLAGRCPELSFLFPFAEATRQRLGLDAPANAVFRSLTWETGLARGVAHAPLTLVPSLWSAPVEGALAKSLALARRVAVVDEATAWQVELPDTLLTRLPHNPEDAASALRAALAKPEPSEAVRQAWREDFLRRSHGLLGRLLELVRPVHEIRP